MKDQKHIEISKHLGTILKPKLSGKVLDIGSGGKMPYLGQEINLLISIVISWTSLINAKVYRCNDRVYFVTRDARKLPIQEGVFDMLVSSNLVQHLFDNNFKETYNNVKRFLNEGYRVLNKNGKIFLFGQLLPKNIEEKGRLISPVASQILRLFHIPMVYFFSLEKIIDFIKEAGFNDISFSCINCESHKISPWNFGVDIPVKFTPFSFYLIEGLKYK